MAIFERFTEAARRTMRFAHEEARAFGAPRIQSKHLLLGLLREDIFLREHISIETTRKLIEARTRRLGAVASSDLWVSYECKRILAYAVEEAERLGHPLVTPQHLALGLFREENCFASRLLEEQAFPRETLEIHLRTQHFTEESESRKWEP